VIAEWDIGFLAWRLILVIALALAIGLEQRYLHAEERVRYGTDRTFMLIAILGFILYVVYPSPPVLFGIGFLALSIIWSIFFWFKATRSEDYGITSIVLGMIVYSLGPLSIAYPIWITVAVAVLALLIAQSKPWFRQVASRLSHRDFVNLAVFLIIAFLVLPLLPKEPVNIIVPINLYNAWIAVIVVSGLSFATYIIDRYILPGKGLILSAVLGGLYSSTATVWVLSRRDFPTEALSRSLVLAVSMMYFRIAVLAVLFMGDSALPLFFLLIILFIAGLLLSLPWKDLYDKKIILPSQNPLELRSALAFGLLYIVFSVVSYLAITYAGIESLKYVAFVAGSGDITTFLLPLYQGQVTVDLNTVVLVTLIATASNNLFKILYAWYNSGTLKISVRVAILTGLNVLLIVGYRWIGHWLFGSVA